MSGRESEAVREHIGTLQQQVDELNRSVEQASRETSQQVTARVANIRAALSRQTDAAGDAAGQAAGQSQNQWQAMKADLAAKIRELHDRIEQKRHGIRADIADDDAMVAEDTAVDALDFASWAVWQAELAVLDVIDARARADERAAAAGAP